MPVSPPLVEPYYHTLGITTPPAPVPEDLLTVLDKTLLDPDSALLRRLSESGTLGNILPEWQRLTAAWNTQHQAHHFPLDDHTLRVVEGTKASPYYQSLTPTQQRLIAYVALLHDIDKNTGPLRLRAHVPVDKIHPLKSAFMTTTLLSRLGFSPELQQRAFTLIHHHQVFGRLFIFYPEGAPTEVLQKIALKVRDIGVLDCLLALSEGDIRGVREKDAIFTEPVAEQLLNYAGTVRRMIDTTRKQQPWVPQALVVSDAQVSLYSGFVLTAPDWSQLFARLEAWHWGGAMALPYRWDLTDLLPKRNAVGALIQFLPENLAYWGPTTPMASVPSALPMETFYSLWQGDETIYPCTDQEKTFRQHLQHNQADLMQLATPALTSRQSPWGSWEAPWRTATNSLESSLFDTYRECLTQSIPVSSWMGIGTRPVLRAWIHHLNAKPPASIPWPTVPAYTISSTG